jgi:threonine dehydrogenase-like Zn-dependent dehydrogenase
VCGSNIPVWEGRPWFEYPLPAGNPGHEGWGRVARVGEGVSGLEVDERVAFLSAAAFAEYDVVPADQAIPLPRALDHVPFPGEPLACALNVMRRAGIEAGDTVAVVGVGFLGAVVVQKAARAGASVVALSRRHYALEVAREQGAEAVIALAEPSAAVRRAREQIDGGLFDVVIEATGTQLGLDVSSELVRERGRLVVAGYHQDGLRQVNMQLWNWRGIDVVNAHERDPRSYVQGMRDAAREAAEGSLDVGALFTHVFPLESVGNALDMARVRPSGFLKALVIL